MTSDTPAPAQEAHVEALAAAICAGRTATGPIMGRGMTWEACGYKDKFREEARLLLASDWLAAFVAERQAEALREAADEVDSGPTFPLPPSVLSALLRERADRIDGGASC